MPTDDYMKSFAERDEAIRFVFPLLERDCPQFIKDSIAKRKAGK